MGSLKSHSNSRGAGEGRCCGMKKYSRQFWHLHGHCFTIRLIHMKHVTKSIRMALRTVAVLALTACALLLTGCLDYDEEMWLNSDLSGRVSMTIALSDKLSDPRLHGKDVLGIDQIRHDVEKVEGLKVEDVQSFKENGKQVVRLNVAFTSWEKLGWIGRDSTKGGSFAGNMKVTHEHGHTILERSLGAMVDAKPKFDGEAIVSSGLAALFLGNNAFTYTLHLPVEPENANSLQVDKANRTVRWRFPLSQLTREPVTMRVEMKESHLVWWVVIGGGVLVVLGAVFLLRIRTSS